MNHSSGRIVTSSPKCELLIPASGPSERCKFCAGERQKKDREKFVKMEKVEPIFNVEDGSLVNSFNDPEVKFEVKEGEDIMVHEEVDPAKPPRMSKVIRGLKRKGGKTKMSDADFLTEMDDSEFKRLLEEEVEKEIRDGRRWKTGEGMVARWL